MKLKDPVVSMENYLRELLGEYEDKYKEISLSQNVFESKDEARIGEFEAGDLLGGKPAAKRALEEA